MAATSTIPITVEADAAARIEELGMRREFEEMLAYTRQNTPDLRGIEVTLEHKYDDIDDPTILLTARRLDPGGDYDPVDQVWGEWLVRKYSPDVCRHFVMLSCYEPV